MKQFIKNHLSFLLPMVLLPEYLGDYFRYVWFSGILTIRGNRERLIGKIIQDYHVVEKGLTMPVTRPGFGQDRIIALANSIKNYASDYGIDDEQVRQGISVILEYNSYHKARGHQLGSRTLDAISSITCMAVGIVQSEQAEVTCFDYFKSKNAPFAEFAGSRKSVRNYTGGNVDLQVVEKAIDLARCTPSSCNKQGTRVHLLSKRENIDAALSIQTGNRGFGHDATALIVITSELGYAHNVYERNEAYVDGGMFAMSVLLGLHHYGVAACPLNCYLPNSKYRKLREICNVPVSEVFVVMISCGVPPKEFRIPLSHRYPVSKIMKSDQSGA